MKQYDYHSRFNFFLSLCKRPIKLLVGTIAYIWLLLRNRMTHYIVLSVALGDSICALTYLNEYKSRNRYEHITIVCTKGVKRICIFWDETFEDLVCIDRKVMGSLWEFARSLLGQYLYSFIHRDRITFVQHSCNMIQRNYWGNKFYSLNQFIKDLVFQIAPDSKIQYPEIPHINIQDLVEKYNIKKDMTVLLNPFANSIKCDVFELFGEIADILLKNGYRVFTLTSSEKDIPIRGTQTLQCSLAEAYWLAEYCGTIIALRSGFLDLMVFAKCKIISIVDTNYGPKHFYQLEKWGVNPDCYTIEYGNNDQEVIQKIMDIMHLDTNKDEGVKESRSSLKIGDRH